MTWSPFFIWLVFLCLPLLFSTSVITAPVTGTGVSTETATVTGTEPSSSLSISHKVHQQAIDLTVKAEKAVHTPPPLTQETTSPAAETTRKSTSTTTTSKITKPISTSHLDGHSFADESSLSSSSSSSSSSVSPKDGIRGVWRVTKVVSLFGPTVAIYLYDCAHQFYERYQPFVSAALTDFAQHLHNVIQSPYANKPVVWLSNMPVQDPGSHSNPHVTAIANEIIRLTNVRLREHAVISRMQMDDDNYELVKKLSDSDVRTTAFRVMHQVLTKGSGQYLQPEEKIAVHALIASSVY